QPSAGFRATVKRSEIPRDFRCQLLGASVALAKCRRGEPMPHLRELTKLRALPNDPRVVLGIGSRGVPGQRAEIGKSTGILPLPTPLEHGIDHHEVRRGTRTRYLPDGIENQPVVGAVEV